MRFEIAANATKITEIEKICLSFKEFKNDAETFETN